VRPRKVAKPIKGVLLSGPLLWSPRAQIHCEPSVSPRGEKTGLFTYKLLSLID
jgi:hypothetical protein